MFCPRCGQQQVLDDVRFCPRCGFPLGGVKQLMAGGGYTLAPVAQAHAVSPRQHGIRQGARLLFLSVALAPVFFAIAVLNESGVPLVFPGTLFLVGLLWMIYARIFGESLVPALDRKIDARLGRSKADYALPVAPSAPANALGPQHANTAEMMRPASVVDHTTNLLDKS